MPDLERGATLTALVEVELAPRPAGTYRVARAEFVAEGAGGSVRVGADAVVEFAPGVAPGSGANTEVLQELEVARAARNLERTVMGLRTEQLAGGAALQELQRTQALLVDSGRTAAASDVAAAIDRLQQGSHDVEKTLVGAILDLDQGKH
jgi:hypothetical protein